MLPTFRYHPNPIATGNVKQSDMTCQCCGKTLGYVYTGSVYGPAALRNSICPWCIADGLVAKKFKAFFCDGESLARAGLHETVIEEVTKRTPGYVSWQQGVWLCCCQDACEFHGDAPREELMAVTAETLAMILSAWKWKEKYWKDFVEHYQPGGNPAVYKFVCRHCYKPRYGVDFT
jgi:uncharacterized protein